MGAQKLFNEKSDLEQVLRQIPVFADFPEELLSPLVSVSEKLEFKKDETIITQGQANARLLFLIHGDVSVFVDGGLVGSIHEPGSLLGEMSVIKRQSCGATLIADQDALLVGVDTEALLQSSSEYKSLYQSVLYCMYSHVLVGKLEATNEKAKQFEVTNFKLKAAEAELKSLNENLEQQVLEKSKTLERRITELFDGVLIPLKEKSSLSESDLQKVAYGIEILAPIKDQLSSGLQLKDQKVLYWDGLKKNHLVTKLALGGSGVCLEQAFTWEEAEEKLSTDVFNLVILDQGFLSDLSKAQKLQPHSAYLVILSGHIQEHIGHMETLGENLRFIFRAEEKKAQIENTLGAVTKILTNRHFGLEPHVGFGVEIRQERITGSAERAQLIEKLESHLAESGVRQGYRDQAKLVLEELLMNAIYDAPCDVATRAPLFNHLPRTEAVRLETHQQGVFSYAFDGTRILISVRDPFGSLNSRTILKYLKNNYASSPQEINAQEGKGGAGRGLHQIVEASNELIFNLSPGKKTEVISIIYTEKVAMEEGGPRIQLFVE